MHSSESSDDRRMRRRMTAPGEDIDSTKHAGVEPKPDLPMPPPAPRSQPSSSTDPHTDSSGSSNSGPQARERPPQGVAAALVQDAVDERARASQYQYEQARHHAALMAQRQQYSTHMAAQRASPAEHVVADASDRDRMMMAAGGAGAMGLPPSRRSHDRRKRRGRSQEVPADQWGWFMEEDEEGDTSETGGSGLVANSDQEATRIAAAAAAAMASAAHYRAQPGARPMRVVAVNGALGREGGAPGTHSNAPASR